MKFNFLFNQNLIKASNMKQSKQIANNFHLYGPRDKLAANELRNGKQMFVFLRSITSSRHSYLMKQIDGRYLINFEKYGKEWQRERIVKEFTFQRNLNPIGCEWARRER